MKTPESERIDELEAELAGNQIEVKKLEVEIAQKEVQRAVIYAGLSELYRARARQNELKEDG